MFDIGWPELLLVAVLVVVVVGPKELPRVMRLVAHWMGKARTLSHEFRGYVDDMVREADLEDIKDQITGGGGLDPTSMAENIIDPDGDIKAAMDFGTDFDGPVIPDDAAELNDGNTGDDDGGSGAPDDEPEPEPEPEPE
ncbi:MAG: twin-arginine translocase subunit TatB, partial [Rhodospirillales bacterium]|nr:twin-arginine translocase subunit TatB [Rhodospirillales bacterium]